MTIDKFRAIVGTESKRSEGYELEREQERPSLAGLRGHFCGAFAGAGHRVLLGGDVVRSSAPDAAADGALDDAHDLSVQHFCLAPAGAALAAAAEHSGGARVRGGKRAYFARGELVLCRRGAGLPRQHILVSALRGGRGRGVLYGADRAHRQERFPAGARHEIRAGSHGLGGAGWKFS